MPRELRPKYRLVPEGVSLPDRDWVTAGGIPEDATESILIPRGYSFLGDDNLGEVAVPFDGWLFFQSTYTHRAGWWLTHAEPDAGSLFVEFLSLAIVRYDAIPYVIWRDFVASPSHGRYVGEVLANVEYVLLREAQRKVTEEMKEANYSRAA